MKAVLARSRRPLFSLGCGAAALGLVAACVASGSDVGVPDHQSRPGTHIGGAAGQGVAYGGHGGSVSLRDASPEAKATGGAADTEADAADASRETDEAAVSTADATDLRADSREETDGREDAEDSAIEASAVCTPGADQTCNDNPILSSLHGQCTDAGTCICRVAGTNPATGRCY